MMAVPPWIRLWLPLGNALLLVAIVETVDVVRNELKDIGLFIFRGLINDDVVISHFYSVAELAFLTVSIGIRLVITIGLLWIGAIFKGSQKSLLAWIIITSVTIVAITLYSIIVNVTTPHEIEPMHAWSIVYWFVVFLIINAYVLYITSSCYQAMSRQEPLCPTGRGLTFLWEYFSNETKTAAMFFLTSEIVLDAEYLVSRQFLQLFFGIVLQDYEGDSYLPIVIEEIFMRLTRILVNAIGIWLVVKEKRRAFRWWCAFTFLLILVSTTIFVILTVQWRGEDIVSTLAYFIMFPGHLLYRFLTLYFCLKFTRADFSRFVL